MKINYKNYPVIKSIHDKKFNFLIDDDDMQEVKNSNIAYHFEKNAHLFDKINVITKPFLKSLDLCLNKLWDNTINENFFDNGTFILKREDGIIETYCYDFELKDKEHPHIIFYYFQDEMLVKYVNRHDNYSYCNDGALSDGITYQQAIQGQVQNLIQYCLFKKYAKIETKILNPNQKLTNIICLYKNETDLKINILDSKWFTNLVKSDGFNVRGHFRLQPKKVDGKMSKELIWISEFQKTGYTSPARMLSVND